jgi:hypothetical protein
MNRIDPVGGVITRRLKARRGLSMVEAMISLVIAATLLTAVGLAFTSTARAMTINDEFFRATQSARVSLTRIIGQVRCGTVNEKDPANGQPYGNGASVSWIELITDTNQDITYKYDSTAKTLLMINNATPTRSYVLARNVQDASFVLGMGKNANNADCVSRVSMNISVQVGANLVRLSGAAAPRMMMTY